MSRQRNNRRWFRSWPLLIVFAVGAAGWLTIKGRAADGPRSVSAVRSRAEFDVLAVTMTLTHLRAAARAVRN
jgi:hypothetical protein